MEKIILKLHQEGLIDTEIAKIINKSPDMVAYYRKKLKLLNNRNKNSIELKDDIIQMLKNKISIYKISKITKCSATYIKKIAKDNLILTLSKENFIDNIKKVKDNPFADLNSPNVNYWLGFLAADGNICDDRLSLTIQERDYEHLVKFTKFLKSDLRIRKVIHYNKFTQYNVSFRNKEVVNFLNTLGITKNKTFTLEMNTDLSKDFIRGLIDGDGYIRKNKYEISIVTGSENFAKQIMKAYKKLFNIEAKLYNFKPKIFTVSVIRKKDVQLILQELYTNADTFLERKYQNAVLIRNN